MRNEFVNLLKSQVGYHEGQTNGVWNNIQKYSEQTPGFAWSDGQPWCATFEAWGAHQQGLDGIWPMTASCSNAVTWWQNQGRWSDYPVLGGPMYMGPGGSTHTGVVYAYDSNNIYTVEGNSNDNGSAEGDGVYLRTRPRQGSGSPYGYGVPAFAEGTISADPKLGGTATASVPAPNTPPSPGVTSLLGPQWPGEVLKLQTPMLHDANVLTWQKQMSVRGWTITVDGWYGKQSDSICRQFQDDSTAHGWPLSKDGEVGAATWKATWNRPVS